MADADDIGRRYVIGKRYRILRGRFQDCTGEVIRRDTDETVVVLVNFEGHDFPVSVPESDVGDDGDGGAGVREPRKRPPSAGAAAAAADDEL